MKKSIETIEQLKKFLTKKGIRFIYKEFSDGTINLVTHDYCLVRDSLKYDIFKVENQKLVLSTINKTKAYYEFSKLY